MPILVPCLFVFVSLTASPFYIPPAFDESPLQVHNSLRWERMHGRDVSATIQRLNSEKGDYSFNALGKRSEAVRRALRLQARACEAWLQEDYEEATRGYWRAYGVLLKNQALSEAIFCLYYLSEIAAEREDFSRFLQLNTRAIAQLPPEPTPYLTGLLFESRAHTLWYLDHLEMSIHYFARTVELWEEISFSEGLLNGWHNLASIYTELGLLTRAELCFQKAILLIKPSTPDEITLQLFSQLALLHHRDFNSRKARQYLGLAREFQSADPNQFLLLQAEIENDSESLARFHHTSIGEEIERHLILGRINLRKQKFADALRNFTRALGRSRASGLRFYYRKAVLLIGETLEREGQFSKAQTLYERAHQEESSSITSSLPLLGRMNLPLLDGWIRCLIRLGREDRARRVLHRHLLDTSSRRSVPLQPTYPNVASADESLKMDSNPLELTTDPFLQERSTASQQYATIEIWPDQDELFVWLEQNGVEEFYSLAAPAPVRLLVRQISDPLYETDKMLQPGPDRRLLLQFGHSLLGLLADRLQTSALLLIPHKELRALPFDLLITGEGRYLFEEFSISYLPRARLARSRREMISEPPLLVASRAMPHQKIEREIMFFKTSFPELRIVETIPAQERARWVHVASHFQIPLESWTALLRPASRREILLRKPPRCELLSIAACDTANTLTSPLRFGLAEDLLNNGAQSLLMSRWKLDELSVQIFLDFFDNCKQGLRMDQALKKAKLDFYHQTLERNGLKFSAKHPWFWAGISYFGSPGKKLFESESEENLTFLLIVSLLLSAWIFRLGVKRIKIRE